jgi:hypothetical protein
MEAEYNSVIQAELGEGGHEAWILLGEVRGMGEWEEPGLAALREGCGLPRRTVGRVESDSWYICVPLISSLLSLKPSFLLVTRHCLYERRTGSNVPRMPARLAQATIPRACVFNHSPNTLHSTLDNT